MATAEGRADEKAGSVAAAVTISSHRAVRCVSDRYVGVPGPFVFVPALVNGATALHRRWGHGIATARGTGSRSTRLALG
jgi:hypothetical protein